MSLEQDIKDLTGSIQKLIEVMGQPLPKIEEPKKPAKKKAVKKAEVSQEVKEHAEVIAKTADDSPLETPAPVSSDVPFSDGQGLTTYVMGKYQKLGPEKGALIQGVLNNLGYQNINDVKPEHYSALHSGIEAL